MQLTMHEVRPLLRATRQYKHTYTGYMEITSIGEVELIYHPGKENTSYMHAINQTAG
jgi:hypothetical protein